MSEVNEILDGQALAGHVTHATLCMGVVDKAGVFREEGKRRVEDDYTHGQRLQRVRSLKPAGNSNARNW